MSGQKAKRLHLLQDAQPQQPLQKADSTIVVLMSRKSLPQGSELDVESNVSDSVSVRGNLDSRITQQQAVGSILAVLRGFQVLPCTGKFVLAADKGTTHCTGEVMALSATEVRIAEKIINDVRKLMEKFAQMYPDSRVEISVSLKSRVSK